MSVADLQSQHDEGLASDSANELIRAVNVAVRAFIEDVTKAEHPQQSTLSIAIAAGLPARITYTVAECGKFTGLGQDRLRRDRDKGLIDFIEPDGERGARISVFELDRYLKDIGALL